MSRRPSRGGGAAASGALATPSLATVVADVNPTYTIRGSVRCAETINDRIAWTAECDGTLKIRSLPKGTELKILPGRARTQCSALLYIEPLQQLWAAFEDGYVRVYSALQSELENEFVATETPGAAVTALLEVEGMVFVAGQDGSLTQWDCQTLTRTRTLPGHLGAIRCLGCYMGPTGSVVFSGSDDGTAKAWDPYQDSDAAAAEGESEGGEGGPCMCTFQGHTKGAVRAIEVVNYANQMWTAGEDATVRVWNLETLACAAVLRGHTAPVTSLLCIESRMWSGDAAGRVMLWDINSCTPLAELSGRVAEAPGKGGILAMKKMQPSTSWKVWTAGANGVVQCWNAETVPILFNNKKKRKSSGARSGGSLQTKRKGSAYAVDEDDEEVQAWRQFQHTLMDDHRQREGEQQQQANADGRRPSLGIVDIQRLAEDLGYERGRMEVQRELQTQQLLEEENAQLKNRLKSLIQQQQLLQEKDAEEEPEKSQQEAAGGSTPKTRAGASATAASTKQQQQRLCAVLLPADGGAGPRNGATAKLSRTFPGDNWSYLLAEKPHELHAAARDELCTALGIPPSQITRLELGKGSLTLDADVQHHKSVPASVMKKRLQNYSFPQLLQLHESARTTPKTGLDAAEANLNALEEKLQAASEADQPKQSSSLSRASPEPHHPSQDELALAQRQRDSLAEEVRHLREENDALKRILEHDNTAAPEARNSSNDNITKEQQYDQLLALKDADVRRLQDQLTAERDSTDYMKMVVAEKEKQREELERQLAELKKEGTPINQSLSRNNNNNSGTTAGQQPPGARPRAISSIPSVSEDRPSVELSPSPPAIDRTNNKTARPYSLLGATDTSEEEGFRSPSQDGSLTAESGLPAVGPYRGSGSGSTTAIGAAARSLPPTAPSSSEGELRSLRAEHARLKEDHEALDAYVQDRLKPLVADLKRARGELGLEIARLEKEKAELQEQLANGGGGGGELERGTTDFSRPSGGNVSLAGANDDVESLARSQTPSMVDDAASLRRELRKSQADAAAKGTALRKVQRELDVLKRAMESEGQAGGGAAGVEGSAPSPSTGAASSAAIDAAVQRERDAKEAELQQLRSDYNDLSQHVDKELKPELAELRRTLADRDAQLQLCQREVDALRDSLEATAGDGEESRMRSEKMGEAVEALRQELENERTSRADLQRELEAERAKANSAAAALQSRSASTRQSPAAAKKSPSQESSLVGRGTQPTYMEDASGGAHGLEAQNLALSVRLADAETVVGELQASLEKTTTQLEAQRRETDRLMNIIADLQENSGTAEL